MDTTLIIVISCVMLVSLFISLLISKLFRTKTYEEVAAEKRQLADKLFNNGSRIKRPKKILTKKVKEKKLKSKDNDLHNNDSDELVTDSQEDNLLIEKESIELEKKPIGGNRTIEKKNNISSGLKQNKKRVGTVVNAETIKTEIDGNIIDKKQSSKEITEMRKIKDDNQTEMKIQKSIVKETKKTKAKKEIDIELEIEDDDDIMVLLKDNNKDDKNKVLESPKTITKMKKKKLDLNNKIDNNLVDIHGVNDLVKILGKAELTHNEIQIIIEYLLNKQQDSTVNHSEWSDDIVQKLRKQIIEKDKELQEVQEASAGIQAKLRDLRVEINTERIQFNANTKAYIDEIQSKKTEIINLNQEIQNINEKFNVERQQFQSKLRHEKQACTQELLAQNQKLNDTINMLQTEIVQKNTIIKEIQMIANASHQAEEDTRKKLNEIIQQQNNKIITLEKQLNDNENQLARHKYDLDLAKSVEKDNENSKVELRNLQNALETTKTELNMTHNALNELKRNLDTINIQKDDYQKQLQTKNHQYTEKIDEISQVKDKLDNLNKLIIEKDQKINEYEEKIKLLSHKDDELLKLILEQKDKNNSLTQSMTVNKTDGGCSLDDYERTIRNLFENLFPEASKMCDSLLSLDEWIEKIIQKQNELNMKSYIDNKNINNTNIETNDMKSFSNNHTQTKNYTDENNINNSNSNSNNNNNDNDNSNNFSENGRNGGDVSNLIVENAQLRAHVDELTEVVTKTESLLKKLEIQARDQEAYWQNIVQSKQDEIDLFKKTNGQAV